MVIECSWSASCEHLDIFYVLRNVDQFKSRVLPCLWVGSSTNCFTSWIRPSDRVRFLDHDLTSFRPPSRNVQNNKTLLRIMKCWCSMCVTHLQYLCTPHIMEKVHACTASYTASCACMQRLQRVRMPPISSFWLLVHFVYRLGFRAHLWLLGLTTFRLLLTGLMIIHEITQNVRTLT